MNFIIVQSLLKYHTLTSMSVPTVTTNIAFHAVTDPKATEHSYSSPKVFRNTHPPTSAIRNTLIEPATHKRRGKERRVDSTPPSAPYPQRSPRRENSRVNDEDIRRQDTRFASPESSFALRRPVTPEYVESSLRAVGLAHHGTVTSTPHYSTSVRETSGRSSAVTIDNLRSPHQTTKRRPLSLAFLVATDSAPVPSSPPLGDDDPILPPLHRLKRKLSQMQDATSERSNPPLKPAAAPVSSTGVPDSMPPAVTYEEDGESPEKKFKKNIMDWRVRKQALETDDLLSAVEAKQVFCKICCKWIKLDARNDYYPGLWIKHRKTMHEKPPAEAEAVENSEVRRRRGWTHEELSPGDEEPPVRKRRTVGNHRSHRQGQSQGNARTPPILNTRPARSSSRITRTSSGFSN
ncbi:hypothetical protein D9756_002021 [Leucocoprinus leucothites]|uniref:Uncharacterized protein n=1 Tax=Leucocoprinus leucothites TaxID=201217 RepID=A0A8H5GCA8_9AGAR|nr:hypothetical protein D9756_002021 [Leucoagaricus leucothites]